MACASDVVSALGLTRPVHLGGVHNHMVPVLDDDNTYLGYYELESLFYTEALD